MSMNVSSWNDFENKCRLYERNKNALGFKVTVKKNQGETGVSINTDVDGKYKSSLKRLIKVVVDGAVKYAILSLVDIPSAEEKGKEYFLDRSDVYLSVLLNKGLDEFTDLVDKTKEIFALNYWLTNINPSSDSSGNVSWLGPDGFVFEDGSWIKKKDGKSIYHTDFTMDWKTFFL